MFDKEIISIDIGSQNTKIAVGRQQGNTVQLGTALMFATPANSLEDGKILDMGRLTEAIRKAISEHKIKAKKAVITIESTSIIRREIELPAAKPEELDTMVRYEVEQYLPIMMSEYIIEYKIIDEYTAEEIKKYKLLVAAMPRTLAEDFLQMVKNLGLNPFAMDINSNAIAKLFSTKNMVGTQPYDPEKTVAILDMGHSYISLTILSKGTTRFSRLIGAGGYDIDSNLSNTFHLEIKEAEERKKKEADMNSESANPLVNDAVRGTVEEWITEIQRMFQYYTSRDNKNKLDEIYIYGGSSNLKGLAEHLKSQLNLPVYPIQELSSIKLGKQDIQVEYFLNAIGAMIRKQQVRR